MTASNPFAFWDGLLSAWQINTATCARMMRTTNAAENVVASRGEIIRAAIGSPATADYGELARIGPEKAMAFAQSSAVVMRACFGVHSAWWRQTEQASRLMTAGRMPSAMDLASLWSGIAQATLGAVQISARAGRDALVPVARAVSHNARRLNKAQP